MLISIEIHITCDLPGGGGGVQTPYPLSGSAHDFYEGERERGVDIQGG